MLKYVMSIAVLAGLAGVPVATAVPMAEAAGDSTNARATAEKYVESTLESFVGGLKELRDELNAANKERAGWGAFSEDWKKWTPEDAEKNKASFTYGEYLWSGRKDKDFRKKHTESAAARKLREFQEKSGGAVAEIFVTDAKGANVCQSAPTSDWFQGDEEKFTKVENKKDSFYADPKRDDTVGKTGIQVSIPVWDTVDGKETFIGVVVALVIAEDVK